MINDARRAEYWTRFLATRPEFPCGSRLLAQFEAGKITRLCDCGCNSYDLAPGTLSDAAPMAQATGGSGSVFEMAFRTINVPGTLEFVLFADAEGRCTGLEVDFCANSCPVPSELTCEEAPYHVRASETLLSA